jgi:hypothetical protein
MRQTGIRGVNSKNHYIRFTQHTRGSFEVSCRTKTPVKKKGKILYYHINFPNQSYTNRLQSCLENVGIYSIPIKTFQITTIEIPPFLCYLILFCITTFLLPSYNNTTYFLGCTPSCIYNSPLSN